MTAARREVGTMEAARHWTARGRVRSAPRVGERHPPKPSLSAKDAAPTDRRRWARTVRRAGCAGRARARGRHGLVTHRRTRVPLRPRRPTHAWCARCSTRHSVRPASAGEPATWAQARPTTARGTRRHVVHCGVGTSGRPIRARPASQPACHGRQAPPTPQRPTRLGGLSATDWQAGPMQRWVAHRRARPGGRDILRCPHSRRRACAAAPAGGQPPAASARALV